MPKANHEQNKTSGSHCEKEVIQNMRRWVWNTFFVGKSAAWTAIFTGVLTVFTVKMYQVSSLTNETVRSAERASLSFTSIGLGVRINDIKRTWSGQEFSLNWINTGNTPASEAVIRTNMQAWPTDLPQGFEFPLLQDKTTAVVGPKGTYGTNVQVPKDILTSTWYGKSRIFFWGTVVYRDVFRGDPDRVSEFCVEMTHITVGNMQSNASSKTPQIATPISIDDPSAAIVVAQWQACREHNCYDEGCKDYSARVKEVR
jgi:hypothetical protein